MVIVTLKKLIPDKQQIETDDTGNIEIKVINSYQVDEDAKNK